MEHVVFFPAHDGTPAFRRVSNLEDAVRLVEHLRNVENVAELSVHALTEVPLSFKAVYKVEMPTEPVALAEVPAQEMPPPLPVEDVVPSVVPDAADVPADVPAMASSNGHADESPSSLGFFAS
jgi:hypothetical protein